ncbi:YhdT family protein [Oceanobacillus alkalisoli]|uniref:YhdT family protein n=1 Tax=Oceanobacillus alkalisoli TaxID=2925113 RepID=UPI001EF143A6|nr:YhdT family protein [Oceanobacillus alkalisoli]MCF3944554.1 YhdT family protein [Oceanobacillus alkalisoli]MCG5102230.1 YhdT family protein [Oceanobacillus alkalisoli]
MEQKERKQEWRFAIANREALIGCGLALFNFVWWFGFAYGLGSKPPEEYTYVMGFPAWIFYSLILGTLVMFVLVALVVKFFLKDISLVDEEETEKDEVTKG